MRSPNMAVDVTTTPSGLEPLGAYVFISYSHDQQGRGFVEALEHWLGVRGVAVICDRVLPTDNPLSMPQWMEHQLVNSVVLCVLTPDYVRGFDHETADGTR